MPVPARIRLGSLAVLLVALAWGCAPARTVASHAHAGEHAAHGAESPREVVKRCRRGTPAAGQACYQEAFLAALREKGAGSAVALLDSVAALDENVKRDGHVYAHAIGINAFTTPGEVGKTFAACTPGYQSGCYHGVIQGYFADAQRRSPGGLTDETVNALCGAYRGSAGDPWLLSQCSHGVGHGLVIYHGYHLPRALRSCDGVRDATERESCYGGAFMENIVKAIHPQHSALALQHGEGEGHHAHHTGHAAGADSAGSFKALDPADLLYPCSAVEEKYWAGCYSIQTAAILHHTRGSIARTAQACDRAPETMRRACHMSLGRDISGIALRDPRETVRMCSQVAATAQPWCHTGVVRDLVNFAARAEDGLAYCRVVPGEESKRECYRAVGRDMGALRYDPARREEVCRGAEEGYVEVCRAAADSRSR